MECGRIDVCKACVVGALCRDCGGGCGSCESGFRCAGSSVVELSIAARRVTGSNPVSRFLLLRFTSPQLTFYLTPHHDTTRHTIHLRAFFSASPRDATANTHSSLPYKGPRTGRAGSRLPLLRICTGLRLMPMHFVALPSASLDCILP